MCFSREMYLLLNNTIFARLEIEKQIWHGFENFETVKHHDRNFDDIALRGDDKMESSE